MEKKFEEKSYFVHKQIQMNLQQMQQQTIWESTH